MMLKTYTDVEQMGDEAVKERFGTTKRNVLKVLYILVKEEFLAQEQEVKPLPRKKKNADNNESS